jgi:FKBP-type peptidyl-prolyl cis-trans isomerase FklB
MKHLFLSIALLLVAGTFIFAQPNPKKATAPKTTNAKTLVADTTAKAKTPSTLKNSLDSFSYALGMNIANNLKQQNIDNISSAAMIKGMNDVFKKKPTEINEQQANGCIQTKIQGNQSKKSGAEKAKAAAFLAKNKTRKEVITLPSGLQYEILKKGDATSASPKLQDTVVAHYAGTLIDGKKFDNSYDRGQPLTIPVAGVIKGWTEILQLMHIGDKFKVFIPSELGYGERGAGADIPGGAALIFEMELLEVKPAIVAENKK